MANHNQLHTTHGGPGQPDDEPGTAATSQIDAHHADSLLDDIDELLEDNAEEFVRSYVQKGGQ